MRSAIRPIHPGEYIREYCLKPLKLTIAAGAKALGVAKLTLSNLVNGKNGVSATMAHRLAKVFGSTPEMWLARQMDYDLAQVNPQILTGLNRMKKPEQDKAA